MIPIDTFLTKSPYGISKFRPPGPSARRAWNAIFYSHFFCEISGKLLSMEENDKYSNFGSESYSESEDDNMLAGMSEEQRVSY